MQQRIDYGSDHLDLEVQKSRLVDTHRRTVAPPLADPAAAMRQALEAPLGFPALRRALTPDDNVVIVLDEDLPHLRQLLAAVLDHVLEAKVALEAITVLCAPSPMPSDWKSDLPVRYSSVHLEVHDPSNRRQLSYLATTRKGRRIYLNRGVVDADQLIVLSRRSYDPLLGYSGAEGAIYPGFSDEATQREMSGWLSLDVPGDKPWPVRKEAAEVAWLLGAPFMLQVVEGAGEDISHVVGGLADTGDEGRRLLDARWRVTVDALADTVIAGVSGNGRRNTFAELANALACAARVVAPEGRIILLSQTDPVLEAGAEVLRQAADPGEALTLLRRQAPADMAAAFQWASAAQRASIYLLSQMRAEAAEELFATPLDKASQVQRLLGSPGSCLLLPDAHKTMAVTTKMGSRD